MIRIKVSYSSLYLAFPKRYGTTGNQSWYRWLSDLPHFPPNPSKSPPRPTARMGLMVSLATHVRLLRARVIADFQNKAEAIRNAREPLLQSWQLLLVMIKISPSTSLLIFLYRFYIRLIPSLDLHIKGGFIDMVRVTCSTSS